MVYSVTAVVLGHENKEQIEQLLKDLRAQQRPPDEIILATCCMDVSDLEADKKLTDNHVNDIGQRFCDWGLRLSDSDYTFFASSDDYYDPEWVQDMMKTAEMEQADLVLGAFHSHLVGAVTSSKPEIGAVTRGSFLVRTKLGKQVGYTGRKYSSDGQFILDLINAGATWTSTPDIHYWHK